LELDTRVIKQLNFKSSSFPLIHRILKEDLKLLMSLWGRSFEHLLIMNHRIGLFILMSIIKRSWERQEKKD